MNDPYFIADCFCNTRLHKGWRYAYGALPNNTNADEIINRAWVLIN